MVDYVPILLDAIRHISINTNRVNSISANWYNFGIREDRSGSKQIVNDRTAKYPQYILVLIEQEEYSLATDNDYCILTN